MRTHYSWVLACAIFFLGMGISGRVYATHDFMSDSYWDVESGRPRVTFLGELHFAGNESVKIRPTEAPSLLHSEGLRIQLKPFADFSGFEPFELHALAKIRTRFDKPDGLETGIVGTHDLGNVFKGGEKLRFEIAYLWNGNLGSSSDPSYGITKIPIGVSYHLFDGAVKPFDLQIFARHYVRSDEPLLRVSADAENLGVSENVLKNELGARFSLPLLSWVGVWAEPSFAANKDFSAMRIVPEGGIYFPIGNVIELKTGARFARPLNGKNFESTETYFVGMNLRF